MIAFIYPRLSKFTTCYKRQTWCVAPLKRFLSRGLKLRAGDGDSVANLHGYQNTMGAVYTVTITRPEISFGVNRVCQFMYNPIEVHWNVVKQKTLDNYKGLCNMVHITWFL